MSNGNLAEIKSLIESAELTLRALKMKLAELEGPGRKLNGSSASTGAAYTGASATYVSPSYPDDASKIIEGNFNGERMQGPDGQVYPVPANYASKSKLVAGDRLKLTIMKDGRFIYKQIGPIPRKTAIGTVVQDAGQYRILANGKSFKVLLASITYYKAHVGDKVTIIAPEAENAEWATIEALLPKDVSPLNVTDDEPEEEEVVDF
jgi:hypothetical protein